jgi:hypothetical protein
VFLRVIIYHLLQFCDAFMSTTIREISIEEVYLHRDVLEELFTAHLVLEVVHNEISLHNRLIV